jgi:CDP-diglyceride synthetase
VTTAPPSTRTAPLWVSALLGVLAIVLIVVAVIYFVEAAHSLPSFFPGHTKHGQKSRIKHGIAALVVGLVALAGAWFTSARKRTAS